MNMTRRSGSELDNALDNASPRAIEALYRELYRQLVRLATLLLRDLGRSEEIVQDVFLDLFQRWGSLKDRGNLAAYVKAAVVHAAVSDLRHRRVVRRHADEPGPSLDSAEVIALEHLDHRRVLAAVNRLPERQRQVLILRYYGYLSEAEIAGALGVTRGSVKSHSSRALRALRPLLEAET